MRRQQAIQLCRLRNLSPDGLSEHKQQDKTWN